ncbi:MAG TPA: hypothetical protein DD422_02210, partial [Akkermansia sp.]|nr:hypothetical protein [Akkermansia sp.]
AGSSSPNTAFNAEDNFSSRIPGMVMSVQMNGHSTAVVKAQLSSRHTFSGKNNRTEMTSPSQPANRTPGARIRLSLQWALP